MKMRPQFNLRFRDAEQFELVMGEAGRDGISMNEWILLRLESDSVVLKGQRVMAEKAEVGNEKGNAGADRGIREAAGEAEPAGEKNPKATKKGGTVKSAGGKTGTGVAGPSGVAGSGSLVASAVSAGWFPNTKCPHGYQNSFACEQAGGGCKR